MGRPPIYETVDLLDKKIEEYFVYIEGEYTLVKKKKLNPVTNKIEQVEEKKWCRYPEPATVTGLALFLGFESRQSFYDYEKRGEFSYTIKRARLKVENEYEKRLAGQSPTGAIFALKNLGWADKHEVDNTHTVKPFDIKEVFNWDEGKSEI